MGHSRSKPKRPQRNNLLIFRKKKKKLVFLFLAGLSVLAAYGLPSKRLNSGDNPWSVFLRMEETLERMEQNQNRTMIALEKAVDEQGRTRKEQEKTREELTLLRQEDRIRLVGEHNRVEVQLNGVWGTLCDDIYGVRDQAAASLVICRS